MADSFPGTAAEITNEWLSGVLGATVTGFNTTFLEGGVLADASKLHGITYSGNTNGAPASVVVKVANAVTERRDLAIMANAYTKELFFFRDLAKDVPLRSPTLYGCFSDGSATSERFIIVRAHAASVQRAAAARATPPGTPVPSTPPAGRAPRRAR